MLRRFCRWLLAISASALGVVAVVGFRAFSPAVNNISSRVTVALVGTLPASGSVRSYDSMILRQLGQGNERDVILLTRATANGPALDAAMRALLVSRAANGSQTVKYRGRVQGSMRLGVVTTPAPRDWTARFGLAMKQVADSLLRAPTRQVDGVGSAPALDFFLPHKTRGLSNR
jgi:hypothetical protein